MIAVFTSWDWTEIGEGVATSLVFIALPILWRIEKHHLELIRHNRHQTKLIEENHYMTHHGEPHPRVKAREVAGEHRTPTLI